MTDAARRSSVLSIAFALAGMVLALDLIAFAFGQAPLATLGRAIAGAWGSPYAIGQVLFKATPLLFTGLAFEVALRAGLFNIGAEGQLAMASLAVGVVGARLPAATPWPVALPVVLVAGAAAGAAWAAVPAFLRAYRGVHEIIGGIMENRIADVLLPWVLGTVLASTTLRTADMAPGATLPRLDRFVGALSGSAASVAFLLGVAVLFATDAWLTRSRLGREMRWIGLNGDACRAEGIAVPRRLVQAMLLSGALAALASTGTVLGYKGYHELGLGVGAGFSGIAVAMLGRGRPAGILLAALLIGTLEQAGFAINARVPKEAMDVLEAVAVLLVAVGARYGSVARREGAAA